MEPLVSGASVHLACDGVTMHTRAEVMPSGHVLFKNNGTRMELDGHLRITAKGAVDFGGGRGPWAQFLVEVAGTSVRIKSVGHQQKYDRDVYLEVRDGQMAAGVGSLFSMVADDGTCSSHEPEHSAAEMAPAVAPPVMALSAEQRAAFMRDGCLLLRDVVSSDLVDEAMRAINAHLGSGSAWSADEGGKESISWGGVGKSPALRDLLVASPALGVAEQLLGPVRNPQEANGGQIALRFPLDPTAARARAERSEEQWHIDGMNKGASHMSGFQLLLGVALSDQPKDDCGNLHVWPGEHTRAFESVRRMRALRAASPGAVEAAGDDPWLGERPKLPADGFRQMHMHPGDIVLAHQKTPHRIGLNRSPHIRYQVYFRLSAVDYKPDAPLTALHDGWHGLQVRDMEVEALE